MSLDLTELARHVIETAARIEASWDHIGRRYWISREEAARLVAGQDEPQVRLLCLMLCDPVWNDSLAWAHSVLPNEGEGAEPAQEGIHEWEGGEQERNNDRLASSRYSD